MMISQAMRVSIFGGYVRNAVLKHAFASVSVTANFGITDSINQKIVY